jgi:porin
MTSVSFNTSCIFALAISATLCGVPSTAAQDRAIDFEGLDFVQLPLEGEDPIDRPAVPDRDPKPQPQPNEVTSQPIPEPSADFSKHLTGNWRSARRQLLDKGLSVDASLVLDLGKNLHGGRDTHGDGFGRFFSLSFTLDTETAFDLPGGTVFLNFQHHSGRSPSDEAGDYQGVFNTDADSRDQIAEFWYHQALLDDTLAIKLGKIDVSADFGFADYAGSFLNGAMGFTLSSVYMPTYPDPAFGFDLFYYPRENVHLGFGLFDGSLAEDVPTGSRGPSTLFHSPADLFLITEIGVNWTVGEGRLPGRARAGLWHHTGTFSRFDGGTDPSSTGYYVILDQRLCRENPADEDDEQGVTAFFQVDFADDDHIEVPFHFSTGLTWTGALPGRDADQIGLGLTHAQLTRNAGYTDPFELTTELFYHIQVNPWFSIKPDLQYIINHGGADLKDAVVLGLRAELTF